MPNVIKYTTGATETGCLRKGNMQIGNNTADYGATFWNGITPPSGGYTIYLNKGSNGPSIYCPTSDTQLVSLTNAISVSSNFLTNGNFADGTTSPWGPYSDAGGIYQIVDISGDKPYSSSTSKYAVEYNFNAGMYRGTSGLLTVGTTYTFSFWAKVTSGSSMLVSWNNQNGSGETNSWIGSTTITTTWTRYTQTFTYDAARIYFYFYTRNQPVGTKAIFTEFTVTEGGAAGGPGLTTTTECLKWFAAVPTDKMVFNINYEAIVTNGLVLNVDAGFAPSYPTTGTTIYDLSGNSNNGTLQNGPTFNSTYGGGIVFDGIDDYYNIPGVSMGTGSLTIDCWFKYQSNNLYLPSICAAGDMWSGDGQTGWGFGQRSAGSDKYYFFGMMESGYRYSVDLATMVDGTIYNFVGTRTISGSQQILKGYLNGQYINSSTNNKIFNLSTSSYYPGYNPTILRPQQYYAGGPNPPPATLYNIKVYSRDLSATEIAQNYYATLNSRMMVTNGLVLNLQAGNPQSYPGTGTIWYDVSGNGNDGVLTNGPTYDSANGGSIVFDGVNDSVELNKNATQLGFANSSFTVTIWYNANNTTSDSPLFSTNGGSSNTWLHYNLRGSLHMGFYNNDTADGYPSTNTTYCATFVYDITSGLQAIYVNGVLNASGTGHSALQNGNNFKIGGQYSGVYNGKIYQVTAYNRALSDTEVLQNYNVQRNRFGL